MINSLTRFLDKFIEFKKTILALMLLSMLCIVFAQVVFRYVIKHPLVWSDEISTVLLGWMGYLCISIYLYSDSHIAITFLYDKASKKAKKILDALRHIFITILGVIVLYFSIVLLNINLPQKLPASQLPAVINFIPLLIGGFFMIFYSLINLMHLLCNREKNYE